MPRCPSLMACEVATVGPRLVREETTVAPTNHGKGGAISMVCRANCGLSSAPTGGAPSLLRRSSRGGFVQRTDGQSPGQLVHSASRTSDHPRDRRTRARNLGATSCFASTLSSFRREVVVGCLFAFPVAGEVAPSSARVVMPWSLASESAPACTWCTRQG